ncbi:MAG: type I restriction endonuclease [Nocardioidaceae bacterium]
MAGGVAWSVLAGRMCRARHLPRANTEVLVEEWLIEALEVLNADLHGAPERMDEVLPLLRMATLSAASEGLVAANERMVTLLRGDHTVKYVGTDSYVPLRLIDFDDPTSNTYVVSDEVTFGPPGHERRFDLVLWVNGLPLGGGRDEDAGERRYVMVERGP